MGCTAASSDGHMELQEDVREKEWAACPPAAFWSLKDVEGGLQEPHFMCLSRRALDGGLLFLSP